MLPEKLLSKPTARQNMKHIRTYRYGHSSDLAMVEIPKTVDGLVGLLVEVGLCVGSLVVASAHV